IVDEVVHHKNAVKTVQKERPRPVPPAALEAPEITKGRAAPAIEATLHRHNTVEFGRSERNRNAPEKRDQDEEEQSHSRAGLRKNVSVAERAAGCVAVENRQQRQKSDGTDSSVLRG